MFRQKMLDSALPTALSDREMEILRLLAEGLSNREIAFRLTISLDTVKWHNKQIYSKMAVSNRTQAVTRAQDMGLLVEGGEQGAVVTVPHNLPAQVTSFVGRQQEVQEARDLLGQSRLLTLTGPGGIGKTRLALQLAGAVLPTFPDGVYFIPLVSVSASDNMLWAIAERLDFQFRQSGKPQDQLLEYLADKRLLLILDNFEHLLDSASLLADMLRYAAQVKMLVTSRERLRLYGEAVFGIHGLALPVSERIEDLRQSESLQLFVQRAHAANPGLILDSSDLQDIAHICRLVEGMPLGIELAASWVDMLLPSEIAHEIEHSLDILSAELQDVAASQRSIRAVFERSWNLLTAPQQQAFQKLSVFRGGFTREAAEVVMGVNLHSLHVLVSKSLLRYDPETGRYEQHELLRHYAAVELEDSGESAAMRQAHAGYFADFMAASWIRMCGSEQSEALREADADIENARAAWQYWIEQSNVQELSKFFNAFWIIYDIKGWYPAGVALFQQGIDALEKISCPDAEAGRGWLLAAQGLYKVVNGYHREGFVDAKAGFQQAQHGVNLLRRQQHRDSFIVSLISTIIAACHFNESTVAHKAARECLEISLTQANTWGAAKARHFLATMAINDGHHDEAMKFALDALSSFEAIGDRWSMSILCIEVIGLLETVRRDFDAARQWIQRGLEAAEEAEFDYARQLAYWQFGYVEVLREDYVTAARYWRIAQHIGDRNVGWTSIIGFSGSSNLGQWGGRKLLSD